jgi:hypothetical protein
LEADRDAIAVEVAQGTLGALDSALVAGGGGLVERLS